RHCCARKNIMTQQSRNVALSKVEMSHDGTHDVPAIPLVRDCPASRSAVKAALRRPRRGLDGASPRCKGYSQMREWRALFWRFRARGRHFYFADKGDISTLPRHGQPDTLLTDVN